MNIVTNYYGQGIDGYSIVSCDMIILITQDFPIPEFQSGHQVIGAPVVNPAGIITFNGYDYSVGDDSALTAPNSCQENPFNSQPYNLYLQNSEWSIAPAEDASSIIIAQTYGVSSPAYHWGASCMVLADGKPYSSLDLTECPLANGTLPLTVTSFKNGTVYTINCYSVPKILLRRASQSPNSWVTSATITAANIFNNGTRSFASLDDATYSNLSPPIAGVQAYIMTLPSTSGWALAPTDILQEFLVSPGWAAWPSTSCWVGAEGVGYTHTPITACGTNHIFTVGSTNYYYTSAGRYLLYKNN